MQNFLFLFIILILQLLAIKIRIELVSIIIGLFGIVLSIGVISEISYPMFNIFVMFMSLVNLLDLYYSRKG